MLSQAECGPSPSPSPSPNCRSSRFKSCQRPPVLDTSVRVNASFNLFPISLPNPTPNRLAALEKSLGAHSVLMGTNTHRCCVQHTKICHPHWCWAWLRSRHEPISRWTLLDGGWTCRRPFGGASGPRGWREEFALLGGMLVEGRLGSGGEGGWRGV